MCWQIIFDLVKAFFHHQEEEPKQKPDVSCDACSSNEDDRSGLKLQ